MAQSTDPRAVPKLYRVVAATLRPIVLGLVRPRVEGLEHVRDDGPAILCSNHLSMLDPVLVPLLLDRPIVYLAKSEYFQFAPTRWAFDHLGVVPVAREGGSAAQASLDRSTEVLRAGGLLSLFPEGTRSPDGRLYRGKTGPVRLALRAPAPIVPIGVSGTRDVMPPHARLPHLGAPVRVRFGAPLHIAGDPDDVATLRRETDRVMTAIQRLSGQEYVDAYARPARRAGRSERAAGTDVDGGEGDGHADAAEGDDG